MKPEEFLKEDDIEVNNGGEEYNDEAGMAKNSLQTIIRVATHLERELGDDENLPEWVEEKISVCKGMIVSAMDYMLSQHEQGHKYSNEAMMAGGTEAYSTESIEDKFNAVLGEMNSSSIASLPATGTGPKVGSLFGGSYKPITPFTKKKSVKKETVIKR